MNGPLLHGKEKALAIKELAEIHGFDLSECFAYSDSHNDLPLLQAVGNPCAINPDAALRLRALREGWPIHDFRRMRFMNRLLGPVVSRIAALGTFLSFRRRSR
jgi:phosphoserine phosphatase